MREIKFRGKSMTWHYGDLIHDSCNGHELIFIDNNIERTRYSVDKDTVGQYTGRFASESAEIFEGDVLEFTVFDYQGQDVQYRGVVEWYGSRFIVSVCLVSTSDTWRGKRDYEGDYYDLDWLLDQDDEVKIIGNIHDNPEMLRLCNA